ncbi:hypothetical protein BAY59_11255 [Prauserella coralliicola]|nr:hypothetical protein BAY59_11255 [Prauserella coralliicola]
MRPDARRASLSLPSSTVSAAATDTSANVYDATAVRTGELHRRVGRGERDAEVGSVHSETVLAGAEDRPIRGNPGTRVAAGAGISSVAGVSKS